MPPLYFFAASSPPSGFAPPLTFVAMREVPLPPRLAEPETGRWGHVIGQRCQLFPGKLLHRVSCEIGRWGAWCGHGRGPHGCRRRRRRSCRYQHGFGRRRRRRQIRRRRRRRRSRRPGERGGGRGSPGGGGVDAGCRARAPLEGVALGGTLQPATQARAPSEGALAPALALRAHYNRWRAGYTVTRNAAITHHRVLGVIHWDANLRQLAGLT